MATYTAPASGGKYNGTSAADQINGQGGADSIYAGAGDDVVYGGGGKDLLVGQDGNDTLDGNAGSDALDGGAGTDLLIYRLAENAGCSDVYSGGTGTDTLRLEFTAAEWVSATVQSEVARYVSFLSSVARTNGEVGSGSAYDFTFNFGGGTTLKVQMMEQLVLSVDGQVVDYNAPRIKAYTDGLLNEDQGSGSALSAQGTIDFTDVNLQDSHTVSVAAAAGNALGGGVTGVISNTAKGDGVGRVAWTYSLDRAVAQRLAVGETAVERFNVTITDSSGKSATQLVAVTVTGANDAPTITAQDLAGDVAEMGTPAGTLSDSGTIAFGDLDLSDAHGVTLVAADAGALGTLTADVTRDTTGSGTGGVVTWSYSVAASALEFLAPGQTRVESFTLALSDGHGGSVQRTVNVTLTGTNDAPVLTGPSAALADGVEDTAYTVTLEQLLQGFTDTDGDALSVTGLTADHGTAVRNADGSWTITPAANYNGPLTLSYGVSDAAATTAATLSLTLAAVNDAPVATGAQATLAAASEGTPFTVTLAQLLQGFTDVDGDALSVNALTVDHGTAEHNGDGSWTITPTAHYHGPITLIYGVSDGTITKPVQLVTTVAAVNDAPELTGTVAVLPDGVEDTAYTVTLEQLLQGFTDADGDAMSVVNLTADHGTVVHNGDGSWTIRPAADYNGALTLSYGVSDGTVSTPATLSLALAAGNDAPELTGAQATLEGTEDTAFVVTQEQLLQGFTDPEGDALSVTTLTADHGTAVDNGDGSWTITPAAHFHGPLTLSYGVSDGQLSTPATLAVALAAVNDAPMLFGTPAALPDAAENKAYTVTPAQLLWGFGDVDGDTLSVDGLTADHGAVTQNANGSWTITLEPDYTGPLTLSYGVSDGQVSTPATQLVEVAAVNTAPELTGTQATLADGTEDTAYTVTLEQLLEGFTDADGDALSVYGLTANHGSTTHNADGSWSITPSYNYNGPLTLSYRVSDGKASTAATLGLTLEAVNDAPSRYGDLASLARGAENTPYTVTQAQLLQGYTDVDGDALSITSLTANHGTAAQNADGSWTITPDADFFGTMTLSYGVSDGLLTKSATLAYTVSSGNHAPALTGAQATLAAGTEDTAFVVSQEQLLQGFTDADGDALSVYGLTANHGSMVNNGDGTWTVTPWSNYTGPVTLSYRVTDGAAYTGWTTLSSNLAGVNDAPTFNSFYALIGSFYEDQSFTLTQAQLLRDVRDADGDVLTVTSLTVDHGTATQNWDGSWTFTPELNYRGYLNVDIRVSDGTVEVPVQRQVGVNNVNDAPALTGAQATLTDGTEDTAYTVTNAQLLQGFTDVDGNSLSVVNLAADHGTVKGNATSGWTITPAANYNGTLTLYYGVTDKGLTTPATLSLKLGAVADAPVQTGWPAALPEGVENAPYTVTPEQLLQGFSDADGDALSVTGLTVDHGTVEQNADGSWTITLEPDYMGTLVLSYGVSDGLFTTPATRVVRVATDDAAPELTGSPAVLADGTEDTAYTVTQGDLLQGFTDADGDALWVTVVAADHGTVVSNGDGTWTITPEPDYNGPVTLSYGVSDGTLDTPATLSLTLAGANDVAALTGTQATLAQGAMNADYTVTQEQLLQGFTDVDGDALSAIGLTADHGTATQNEDGSWTITPEADYEGPVTLSYGVSDGTDTTPATLELAVARFNNAPGLVDAQATLDEGTEDTAYTVTQAQLLQGFADADGDGLSVAELTVDHGTAVDNGDGSWTITPEANYTGPLTLSYGVSDGRASTPASLSLTLAGVNDAPVLGGEPAAPAPGIGDVPYIVTQAQLLQGFTDVDGDGVSVAELTADHGAVLDNGDGSWTITPEAGYTGPLVLSYGVSDGVLTTPASLVVALVAANVAPVLTGTPAVLAEGTEDTAYVVAQEQLLQGFTDANGDLLSVTGLTVDRGTVVENGDGTWTITPEANYNGALTLSYGVSDGALTTPAALSLALATVNDPVALTGAQAVLDEGTEDSAYVVTQAQLLEGFTDVDGDMLSVRDLTVDRGTVVDNGDGSWTITPEADYNGPVTLSYGVSDGTEAAPATLSLTLAAANDVPVFDANGATLAEGTEDTAYTVTLEQLLQGFTDVDGDGLWVNELTVDHGAAVQNGDGSWTITPAAHYNGPLTLSYGVSDGTATVPATLSLTLAAVDDAPDVPPPGDPRGPALLDGTEDTAYTVTLAQLLQDITDVESDPLSVVDLAVDHGTLVDNGDGSWTITLEPNYNGPLTLSYGVSDGTEVTPVTQVVQVAAVNDAPVLPDGTVPMLPDAAEDTAYTVTQDQLLYGFVDVEGDTLSVTGLTVEHGTLVDNGDGSWTITPQAEYSGPLTLSYGVGDGTVTTPATLELTVTAVDDAPVLTGTPAVLPDATEDRLYTVTQEQLLLGFTDVEGDTLSAINLVADHGTAVDNGDGTWTIGLEAEYNGPLTLSYGVSDGTVATPASLSVSVNAVDDTPVLTGTPAVLAGGGGMEDTVFHVTMEQLLQGYTAADGDPLSVVDLTITHGDVSSAFSYNDETGAWTAIVPEANYHGPVTLSYGVTDGTVITRVTRDVALAAVNDAPALTGEQDTLAEGTEDAAYTVRLAQLLKGFSDVDGDALSVNGLTVDHGTALDNGDGTWTITPDGDYNGPLTLSYNVSDGALDTPATLALVLAAASDAPALTGTPATLAEGSEDTAYTVTPGQLLEGFTDVDGDALSVIALTVDRGEVVQNEDGSWTITAPANYNGPLTLVYGVSDGTFTTPATLSLALAAVDDAPALTGTAATLAVGTEDLPYTVTQAQLLEGFTDAEGDTMSVTGLWADFGAVADNGDGTWTITPQANYNGPLTLSYDVSDGTVATPATLAFEVAAVNDAPELAGAPAALADGTEDTLYTVTAEQLLQGFSDAEGGLMSVTGLTADQGTVADNGDGTWTITLPTNYNGTLALSYGVSDGMLTTPATLNLTVTAVDDAPVLTGTAVVLPDATEDTLYTVTQEQLSQGFTDVDDGDMVWPAYLTADHGTVYLNSDSSWTIQLDADYNGPLTLSYLVTNAPGTSPMPTFPEVSLVVNVAAVNDAPVLTGAQATLDAGTEDTAYVVTQAQLLEGFSDVDGDVLSVTGLTSDHGTAVQNPDGSWTITPQAQYSGVLTLSYDVSDGTQATPATLSLALTNVNNAPVLTGEKATLPDATEDTLYWIPEWNGGLEQGFTDADGEGIWAVDLTADHGRVWKDGSYWFVAPDANYTGTLTLSYGVTDGTATTPSTLTLMVNAVNDAPALTGTQATLAVGTEDLPYTVTQAQLLEGFTDAEGDTMSVTGLWADFGAVADNGDGTWTITPQANYNGPLTLSYGVSDGTETTPVTLALTLAAVNDAPVDTSPLRVWADGIEDTPYLVSTDVLLSTFVDADGDALSLSGLAADHGTLTDNGDGIWTFTPDANYHGLVTLSYVVSDGQLTAPGAIGVEFASVDDVPVLGTTPPVLPGATEDMPFTIMQEPLLAGFTDVEGDGMSVIWQSADHATLTDNGDGSWSVSLEADYNGPLTLSYVVNDGMGDSAPVTLVVDVAAVDDTPVLTGTQAVLADATEDQVYTVTRTQLLQGYAAADGDALDVAADPTVDHGGAHWYYDYDLGDVVLLVEPEADYNGPLTLSYVVTDGATGRTEVTRVLDVAAIDDTPMLTGTPAELSDGVEDADYTVTMGQLVQGYTAEDGDPLGVAPEVSIDHGSAYWVYYGPNPDLLWGTDYTLVVTPEADYNGPLKLTYVVGDGSTGEEHVTEVTRVVNLAAVNDAPQLTDAPATLADGVQDEAYTVPVSQLLQGYSDVEGDTLSVAGLSADHGSVVDNGDGTWTITPESGYSGTLLLDYDVSDGTDLTHVQVSTQLNLFMG